MRRRTPWRVGLATVALGLSLLASAPAGAAIYSARDSYDDQQVLGFEGDTYGGVCGPKVDYVTAPSGAYNLALVKPRVGDPTDAGPGQAPGQVTGVVQQGNRFAVSAQSDPSNCLLSSTSYTRIEYTQRVRLDGHCTTGDENLAPGAGFVGHLVATNVGCEVARSFVRGFRFHGAGVGATFRYRGYRCHVSGHPEAATIRCARSRHRAIRWNVGD